LEDDGRDVELLRMRCAELENCELIWASSRAEYLSAFAESKIDGVISDSGVFDLTGLDALALARRAAPNVPFVFLSGAMSQAARDRILAAGPDGVFSKDNPEEVNAALRVFLR